MNPGPLGESPWIARFATRRQFDTRFYPALCSGVGNTTLTRRTIDLKKNHATLADLVEETRGGGEIVITMDSRPVAKLVSIPARPQRQFGSAKGLIEISEDFDEPLEDFHEYTV